MKILSQRGFTLVELSFVVLITGILAAASVGFFLEDWRQKKTDITAAEIWAIGTAAQKFSSDNGAWPNQGTSCNTALTTLTAGGYLGAVSTNSPWYDAAQFPNARYTTSCNANRFTVAITINPDWAGYIANNLAATSVSGSTSTTFFPIAASVPALAGLLHRHYDSANPDNNKMETNLNMGGYSIASANNIAASGSVTASTMSATNFTATGKNRTLTQAVQDITVLAHNGNVLKPTCPAGQTAQIFVAPARFVGGSPANPIGGVNARAIAHPTNSNYWRVQIEVLTKDGWITNSAQTQGRVLAMTKCT